MPNPKGNAKLTGDTHLPDAESDLEIEEGTSSLAQLAHGRDQRGRPVARRAGTLAAPKDDTTPEATTGAGDASSSDTSASSTDAPRAGGSKRKARRPGAK